MILQDLKGSERFFRVQLSGNMAEYFLIPVSGDGNKIPVPSAKTVIGRGPFLQVSCLNSNCAQFTGYLTVVIPFSGD